MADNKDDIYKYQPLWGKWYVELPLGKGSFGSVYKITREEMGNKYSSAVKVITVPSEEQYKEAKASLGNDEDTLNGYFEDIVKNIVNEINVLYSLGGNSNIIGYQDHEVIKNSDAAKWDILIRMELVTSLTNYLENHRFSREQVIKLGMDICTALEICSKKGIIHRDIKDENIFISEDGMFKLGDFGIAKELSKSGRAASMRGTPLYMAPEVFKGEKYDAAVDIYSLGIVMYKLLNGGRMPFMPPYPQPIKYKDGEDALEKRISGTPLPLPSLSGASLGSVVLQACAHDPKDRYSSATAMKHALAQVLAGMSEAEREELVTFERTRKTEPPTTATQQSIGSASAPQMAGTVGMFEAAGNPLSSYSVGLAFGRSDTTPVTEQTIGICDASQPQYQQPVYTSANAGIYQPYTERNTYPTGYSQPNDAYRQPSLTKNQVQNRKFYIVKIILSSLIFAAVLIQLSSFAAITSGFYAGASISILIVFLFFISTAPLIGTIISKRRVIVGNIIIIISVVFIYILINLAFGMFWLFV